MSRRSGPRSLSDIHGLFVANEALAAVNRHNEAALELLLPLAGGSGTPPPRAGERLLAAAAPDEDGMTDRERFRRLVLRLLPSEMPDPGRLRDEDALQARCVLRCHRGVRAEGWAVLPLMVNNEVNVPRRGSTPAQRAADRTPLVVGGRLKSMGMLAGAWDLPLLLWPPRVGWVEFKRPKGQPRWGRRDGRIVRATAPGGELSDRQRLFRAILDLRRDPNAVVETDAEFEAAVLSWGVAEGAAP